ncbi:DUF4232 domain-containing protein [Arthrobacter crystallopoietes]|nr:DUF4232 domain-containing protein [Arthrobacter crystallopoietes]AUI51114.1 hypothetical protein AC20117_10080 [Arthrobacter crystallopoietes]
MVKRNKLPGAAAAVLMGCAVLLAGCGQPESQEPAGSAPATSPAAPEASAQASGSASGSGSAATESTPAEEAETSAPAAEETDAPAEGTAETGECKADQLEAAIKTEPGAGAAGSVYRSLVVTNVDSEDCTVRGYPGVSYVDAAGNQVGAPADRDPAAEAVTVTLAPGESAVAKLQQTNAGNYGPECNQADVAGVRVYPPNDTAWLTAPQETIGCANEAVVLMTVGTFVAA